MGFDALVPKDAVLLYASPAFRPELPLRSQLSALGERLCELRLAGGLVLRVGFEPERSPGGAFRITDGSEERWADDWASVERLIESWGPSVKT